LCHSPESTALFFLLALCTPRQAATEVRIAGFAGHRNTKNGIVAKESRESRGKGGLTG